MARPTYRLRISNAQADVVRGLHPRLKRKIREAFRAIAADPDAGKPLKEELQGLRSFRVGRFRIVYRVAASRLVEVVSVGPRENIYEETYRLVSRSE
jgi:mRNA interferase RelE/StbE